MPRYDRTGPLGAGPGTGRGLGRCGAYTAEQSRSFGETLRGVGRGEAPWGGGRGRCFGGRGMGCYRGSFAGGTTLSPSEEAEALKVKLTAAEQEIAVMKARLEELDRKG
jgi:hypothetical protein